MSNYETLLTNLQILRDLTEKKINAVLLRQADQLMQLLQEELDPLRAINQNLLEVPTFSEQERDIVQFSCQKWSERAGYLAELLQTQLGYLDFLRSLLGIESTSSLNLGL